MCNFPVKIHKRLHIIDSFLQIGRLHFVQLRRVYLFRIGQHLRQLCFITQSLQFFICRLQSCRSRVHIRLTDVVAAFRLIRFVERRRKSAEGFLCIFIRVLSAVKSKIFVKNGFVAFLFQRGKRCVYLLQRPVHFLLKQLFRSLFIRCGYLAVNGLKIFIRRNGVLRFFRRFRLFHSSVKRRSVRLLDESVHLRFQRIVINVYLRLRHVGYDIGSKQRLRFVHSVEIIRIRTDEISVCIRFRKTVSLLTRVEILFQSRNTSAKHRLRLEKNFSQLLNFIGRNILLCLFRRLEIFRRASEMFFHLSQRGNGNFNLVRDFRFQRRFRLFKGAVIRRYGSCFKRFFGIGQRRQQPVHGRLIEVGVSVCRNRGFRSGTSRPERLKRRNGVIVFTIFLDGIE